MARITKEIKKWIDKYVDADMEVDYQEHLRTNAYAKLKELGMTDKQLEDRGITEW